MGARSIRRKTIAIAVAACFSGGMAQANPTNPAVVHGTATFQQTGGTLNITNSHNAIINWGSFSIGVNELTKFIQPSALSAVLNRVTGQDPSAILGALQSNGRVFLINPNGIMFGAGAQINVAGLVASTLNLSNADFLAGKMNFTDGAGAGNVVNQGSINAGGGPVYLVGNAVTNQGLITSPQGEIVLAAGNNVELVNPGTPNLRVEIQADSNEARNLGNMVADAGRIGIYAGLIKQGGIINADSAVSEGGRIMLKSTKLTDIEAGSVTSARGTHGGEILVFSDMTEGGTRVAGTLDASAIASGSPGNGGFIETSAATVNVAGTALVAAEASNGGARGRWLIDPSDFTIAATGGNMTGADVSLALSGTGSGTEFDIQSSSGGSIFVNDSVSWSNDAIFRLLAYGGNINVNSAIANSGAGAVKLYAGWDGASTSVPTVSGSGAININAPVSTGGSLSLISAGGISQAAAGVLTAPQMLAVSTTGSVNLATATNAIGTVAGRAVGQFALKNSGNLDVGTVSGTDGIVVNGANSGMHATLGLEVTSGNLTVIKPMSVTGADGSGGQAGGNASIALTATGGITVNSIVTATGGDGGSSYYSGGGANLGGNAQITMTAGSALTVSSASEINAYGGDGGYTSSGIGGSGGNALVDLKSAGTLSINSSTINSDGGSGSNGAKGGNGRVKIASTGGSVFISGSTIDADGGLVGSYSNANGGDGAVQIEAPGDVTIDSSTVTGSGGDGAEGGNGGGGVVLLSASGGISISGISTVRAKGGDAGSSYYYNSTGTGGGAGLTMLAGGAIVIDGSEGQAQALGGSGDTGGNAAVNIVGGTVVLTNGATVDATRGSGMTTNGVSSALVASAGNLNVNSSTISTDGFVGLVGSNIFLDNEASVTGSTGASASTSTSLTLSNDSSLTGGNGIAFITTGGDVVVQSGGSIYGSPDVVLKVGGKVRMNSGGVIEAGSANTLKLTFASPATGGFLVNGIQGLVYDSATGTGFIAGGNPAVLGGSLLVSFENNGVTNSVQSIPTQNLIVALIDSIKPPAKDEGTGALNEKEDPKKKKDTKSCS